MAPPDPSAALRYRPEFEQPAKDEARTTAELIESMRGIQETTFAHSGKPLRSVHAKAHGVLRGELEVLPGLPAELAQGLYATPGRWPVVMRLSTNPGDLLDDKVSTPRGLAIKVVGVPGERLPGSESDATQDYVLVNGPAFLAPDPASFLRGLKLLAATTDRAPGLKKAASAALRGVERGLEAAGHPSPNVVSLGGQPLTHPLGETYYSQGALLHGAYMAKVSVAPVSPELVALAGAPVDLDGKPDGLRDAVAAFFREQGGEWALRVQLCTDLDAMPIEDPSVAWDEARSPWIAVARLRVPPQDSWSPARVAAVDEGMSFSPWHGLAAHRPLGAVMRVRKAAYEAAAAFRAERGGRALREPRDLDELPD